MQNMVILGATGSIGSSTLSVISQNPQAYNVFALVANTNVEKMLTLCEQYNPEFVHMVDSASATQLKYALGSTSTIEVSTGEQALNDLVSSDQVDMVMAAIVGAAGLVPTLAAVKAGKKVLLANKEALVMSGQLFMDAAKESGATIMPVDSEHNAIFQCLPTQVQQTLGFCELANNGIDKILLTGSGGPFLATPIEQLKLMTPAQACKHPNWSMGPKISVDSATMMNKGLEFIEARWLFNATNDQLKVLIHPQSVIHSMVQYKDASVIAQMGNPDMRTPIAYCMAYPQRINSGVEPLDFLKVGQLSFCEPDFKRYPCLELAIEACSLGQEATTVLNAANETSVAAFLRGNIGFTDIIKVNAHCLNTAPRQKLTCIDDILELDCQTRQLANAVIGTM